jgi:hypothetical protein
MPYEPIIGSLRGPIRLILAYFLPKTTASMRTLRHALLSGAWTEAEQEQVAKAIDAFEDARPASYLLMGQPWVCSKEEVGDCDYFLASRLGHDDVLIGRSPAELVEKIRGLQGHLVSEVFFL